MRLPATSTQSRAPACPRLHLACCVEASHAYIHSVYRRATDWHRLPLPRNDGRGSEALQFEGMADATRAPLASGPLLDTKFYLPQWRPGLVPRTGLVARLNQGTESRLVLVSAPAGFGKTTLLAEWLATAAADGRPVAWLSLDPSDNQQRRRHGCLRETGQVCSPQPPFSRGRGENGGI